MSPDDKVRIVCPECNKALLIRPASLGQWVTCPACSVMFTAEAATPEPPPRAKAVPVKPAPRRAAAVEDEEEKEELPRARSHRDDEDEDEDDYDRPRQRAGRCPKCGASRSTKVSFTWWGGILGPAIFGLVRCNRCSTQYNTRNGKPIGAGHIIVYSVVVGVIALAIVVLINLGIK